VSIVSTIHDAYLTLLEAELPNHTRIPNGLDPVNTVSLLKTKGYALTPSDGLNTERLQGCKASFIRNYTVSLFTQVTSTENNAERIDQIHKQMLEDALLVQAAVEKSTVLNNASTGIGITKFTDDSGMFFLTGEREKFLQLDMNFQTEYFINLD
jgi:hypothetical protein